MAVAGQKYKIKLESGRILGPIDLNRVRLLMLKNQITGHELAREHPQGDWVPIEAIVEIGELLVARAEGKLSPLFPPMNTEAGVPRRDSPSGTTRILPVHGLETQGKPGFEGASDETIAGTHASRRPGKGPLRVPNDPEGTETIAPYSLPSLKLATQGNGLDQAPGASRRGLPGKESFPTPLGENSGGVQQHPTMMMSNPFIQASRTIKDAITDSTTLKVVVQNSGRAMKKRVVGILATLAVAYILVDLVGSAMTPSSPLGERIVPLRPALPTYSKERVDPRKSAQAYTAGMRAYLQDTVTGYQSAARKFRLAGQYDIGNVRALALLASSYLNLIDSSNKDENYFNVITKLIELSRAKSVDLPETVIAEVELYLILNKPESAQNRIVDYTRAHDSYGPEMFYYLALALYNRGEYRQAANIISQYPEEKFFSAKVYYLRGQIAESLEDNVSALKEYEKAVKLSPGHAKSHLAIALILNRDNRLAEAATHLEYIVNHPLLLSAQDLGRAYYLHALLAEQEKKTELAIDNLQRAIALDGENHEYLLELYQMMGAGGNDIKKLQPNARMYYFLGQGELYLREGNPREALTQFLQAREANDKSPLPLVKIGDMFYRMRDLLNARANYKMAAERVPNNIQVWSKYIEVLIQSYEWEEARRAMDRFRKLPVDQSAIDKAAADILQRQGAFAEAQHYYRNAMARDVIDPSVYSAYARNLMSEKNFAEAPFFFALALRVDPLNMDALVGTARCILNTEGIDRAISFLQDELQKRKSFRAELQSAIAELLIEKGAWQEAQTAVDEAMKANPDYAHPWKLQAQIYLAQEGTLKGAVDKALVAFESYSDRNTSDPSGYLERYRLFAKKGDFEKASEELSKIFGIYPKYPNLHLYKGLLYSMMGNHKLASEEFKSELSNDPNSIATLLAYGREFIQMEQIANAVAVFNKAMQLAPRSAEAKMEAGWANYLQKNFQGAVALYQAALSYDQGNPLIYKRLGLAYRDSDNLPEAAKAFREYLRLEPDAADKAEIVPYTQ